MTGVSEPIGYMDRRRLYDIALERAKCFSNYQGSGAKRDEIEKKIKQTKALMLAVNAKFEEAGDDNDRELEDHYADELDSIKEELYELSSELDVVKNEDYAVSYLQHPYNNGEIVGSGVFIPKYKVASRFYEGVPVVGHYDRSFMNRR